MATATKPTGSQFDGLLAPRKRPQPEEQEPAAVAITEPEPKVRATALKREAKALAKSKDDAYQGRTFYVRKKTYAECDYVLKTTDDPRDMSDLAEELLSAWMAKEAKRSAR